MSAFFSQCRTGFLLIGQIDAVLMKLMRHKRAADSYEWFIHKMCILDTELLKKLFNYWRKLIN